MGIFSSLKRNKPPSDAVIADRMRELIEFEINPMLASHGGSIELVSVDNFRAHVKFGGGCQGCAASALTMKAGVENRVKEMIPEVIELIDVTDHSQGDNPYYTS